jgi:hypothetical protein
MSDNAIVQEPSNNSSVKNVLLKIVSAFVRESFV